MEAVLYAVKGFINCLHGRVVRLMCDVTVVLYIKQVGGTRSFRLTRLTIRLLKFCDRRRIMVIPVHLPVRNNIQADRLSRPGQMLPTEWEIHPDLLQPVFNCWGRLWIDLFATFANKKCPKFVSPFPDPWAAFIDILSIPWSRMGTVYAFPPFKIIPSVLTKIRQSVSLTVILIAPYRMDASSNAGASTALPGQTNSCSRRSETSNSCHSSNRRSHREPDLPVLKPTCLATLKALFKKLGYDDRASQIMTSTLRHSSINLYESHWQRFVDFCRRKKTHVLQVRSQLFCRYLVELVDDVIAPSTVISHRTSVASVLRHWKYDPATDPNVRLLLQGMRLARPVTRRTMPQWDLHLVLLALMRPPLASAGARPTDANIELKWRTLKTCFLLAMAMARRQSIIHALIVAPAHITFGRGDVDGQSNVSLLPEPGILAKNQLPSQVPRCVTIPGVDHLHPDDCERMLCPVRPQWYETNSGGGVSASSFTGTQVFVTFYRATFQDGLLRWWNQLIWHMTKFLRRRSLLMHWGLCRHHGHITVI